MLAQNQYHSYNLGELPLGCQYCVKGEKLVVFVTGICPRTCYFCPVSDHKYNHDLSYANERKSTTTEDLIKEAELMNAKGAGITGGDPLAKLDRTLLYIKKLKETFGKDFHIHLYTSLNLVTEHTLQQLSSTGLDEIRFHLDLESDRFWKKLELVRRFPWDIGVELPLIPTKEKETIKIIDYIQDKVQFINLNELEIADNSQSKLAEMGFVTKAQFSYAIKGSVELGLRLLNYIETNKYPLKVHVCTAKLKDAIQLTNRLKKESEGMKQPFDIVDKNGVLIRGAIYLPELAPGFDYRKKLSELTEDQQQQLLHKLQSLHQQLKSELSLTDQDLFLDTEKYRLLLSAKNARIHSTKIKQHNLLVARVEEMPTADQLELEVEFL